MPFSLSDKILLSLLSFFLSVSIVKSQIYVLPEIFNTTKTVKKVLTYNCPNFEGSRLDLDSTCNYETNELIKINNYGERGIIEKTEHFYQEKLRYETLYTDSFEIKKRHPLRSFTADTVKYILKRDSLCVTYLHKFDKNIIHRECRNSVTGFRSHIIQNKNGDTLSLFVSEQVSPLLGVTFERDEESSRVFLTTLNSEGDWKAKFILSVDGEMLKIAEYEYYKYSVDEQIYEYIQLFTDPHSDNYGMREHCVVFLDKFGNMKKFYSKLNEEGSIWNAIEYKYEYKG